MLTDRVLDFVLDFILAFPVGVRFSVGHLRGAVYDEFNSDFCTYDDMDKAHRTAVSKLLDCGVLRHDEDIVAYYRNV